jgi:hypothetical protein
MRAPPYANPSVRALGLAEVDDIVPANSQVMTVQHVTLHHKFLVAYLLYTLHQKTHMLKPCYMDCSPWPASNPLPSETRKEQQYAKRVQSILAAHAAHKLWESTTHCNILRPQSRKEQHCDCSTFCDNCHGAFPLLSNARGDEVSDCPTCSLYERFQPTNPSGIANSPKSTSHISCALQYSSSHLTGAYCPIT